MTFQFCDKCNKVTEHLSDSEKKLKCHECFVIEIENQLVNMKVNYSNERQRMIDDETEIFNTLNDPTRCHCFHFHNVPMQCIYCSNRQAATKKSQLF